MVYLTIYDIAKDKTRTKLANSLEAVGLYRIQKSVFAGKVKRKILRPLIKAYAEKLEEGDRLYVLSLEDRQVEGMFAHGLEENLDLILGRVITLTI
ncbi:MAG: CRISPR-associated endonuclease Cas2 [Bacteroidota bacterium]